MGWPEFIRQIIESRNGSLGINNTKPPEQFTVVDTFVTIKYPDSPPQRLRISEKAAKMLQLPLDTIQVHVSEEQDLLFRIDTEIPEYTEIPALVTQALIGLGVGYGW